MFLSSGQIHKSYYYYYYKLPPPCVFKRESVYLNTRPCKWVRVPAGGGTFVCQEKNKIKQN